MVELDADKPLGVDVLIAGGGGVGLALALSLHQASSGALRIAIAEPHPNRATPRGRAYAIAAATRAFLDRLGLWPRLAADAQPIRSMRITDSRVQDPVRPAWLSFDGGEPPLAHILDEADLIGALREAAAAAAIPILPAGVASFSAGLARLDVALSDGRALRAALIAAADGARSPTRALADLPTIGWDYKQFGLVATVAHERDHQGEAVQHFLPNGPFAILPMTGRRSSIVWTEEQTTAETMLALHPDDLKEELDRRFGAELGAMELQTPLASFPLRFQMARRFVGDRVALIGDAAHVVHPLAGQGLNLGLEDAEALSRRIIDAARLGLDAGDQSALAAYERDRRAAAVAMGVTTDLLNRLFSNDATSTRLMRDFGLGVVDRLPSLKDFFMRRAAGHSAAA